MPGDRNRDRHLSLPKAVRMPNGLQAWYERLAAETGQSVNAAIVTALEGYRQRHAAAVVTEYGQIRKSGDTVIWDTAPYIEKAYPLAKRIEDYRLHQGVKVYRRRVIVVEDWVEVDAP